MSPEESDNSNDSSFDLNSQINEATQWIEHDGGPMPITPETAIKVRYRNGLVSQTIYARQHRWEAWPEEIGESDWDIISWRLVRIGSS